MERTAMGRLQKWKEKGAARKPMIIRGARQVGKTWLMKEFAKSYAKSVYINFDNDPQTRGLFEADLDVRRIVSGLEIYAGQVISPDNTLLIFDEIQEVPKALTSLKYFNENAPQYQIVCASSLLGVALHSGTSFPVGKVEFLDLFPLSFSEYMAAVGKGELAKSMMDRDWEMVAAFASAFAGLLTQYYYVGGMPEVVACFAKDGNFGEAREIQRRILDTYEQDISKHAPNDTVPRIRSLWNSIPAQLGRENKKFVYGLVREGSRAKEYELTMLWLADCGLVHKLHRISVPRIPFAAYEDPKAFKLFPVDVGLLSCMARLRPESILDGSALHEFKGALTEQYVMQQLKTLPGLDIRYWTNDGGTAEVDFVADIDGKPIPVEVKATVNLQSKSLKVYREKFKPYISVRSSMTGYKMEDWLLNLPLYAIETLPYITG